VLLASEGALVVVNDLGVVMTGEGANEGPAHEVAAEIRESGGQANANTNDISSWEGGQGLIRQALADFGRLDILVNNAGILQDRMSFTMDEGDWDSVIKVHMRALRHQPVRCRALAPGLQGDRGAGKREDRQHFFGLRALWKRRPAGLRRGQGRHRRRDHRLSP
jgi:NAD(P)-dependent dehydrogenase (short-subunit alcohol dehydrogenase family)